MKLRGFFRRGNTWYIRKHVSPCLQEAIGKTEFVECLKTTDRAIAEQRYHARYAEILTLLNQDHDDQAQPAIPLTTDDHYRRILDAEFPYRVKIPKAAYGDENAFWTSV